MQAHDAAGNCSTSPSVAGTVGNGTTAPTIVSFSLTDGMQISPQHPDGQCDRTDNQSVAKISLVIDGKEVAVAWGGSLSYGWSTRKLATGTHTVSVRADNPGNVTSGTVTVCR